VRGAGADGVAGGGGGDPAWEPYYMVENVDSILIEPYGPGAWYPYNNLGCELNANGYVIGFGETGQDRLTSPEVNIDYYPDIDYGTDCGVWEETAGDGATNAAIMFNNIIAIAAPTNIDINGYILPMWQPDIPGTTSSYNVNLRVYSGGGIYRAAYDSQTLVNSGGSLVQSLNIPGDYYRFESTEYPGTLDLSRTKIEFYYYGAGRTLYLHVIDEVIHLG